MLQGYSRQHTNYPTIARTLSDLADFVVVDNYSTETCEIHIDPEHLDLVAQWLGLGWVVVEQRRFTTATWRVLLARQLDIGTGTL